jgi:hypothetical protein
MKVLIRGGRDFQGRAALRRAILEARPSLIITGGARGADRLGDELGIGRVIFPANWSGEGRSAGFFRNQRMLDLTRPDLVIACEGGRGTADMVRRAERAGVRVRRVGEGAYPYRDILGDLI